MKINRTCCAAILLIGGSSAAFGQSGDFPPSATPRSSVPDGASTESRGPDQREFQGLVPRVPRPVEQPRLDTKTSHPVQIHSQLGLIAEQLTAAGLVDEARHLQGLQHRVSGEYHARLLTVHKAAPAKAAVQQIALRVRLVEIRQTPETAAAMKSLLERPNQPDLIDKLVEQGHATINAVPQMRMLSGRTVQFRQGYEIPAPPEQPAPEKAADVQQAAATDIGAPRGTGSPDEDISERFVGTFVRATAVVVKDNLIRLSIVTGHSERGSGAVAGVFPAVNRQRLQTEIEVVDGQTMALGATVVSSAASEVSRVPMLGSIPGVGRLFSSTKTKIQERLSLVLVTPEIVRPEAHENPSVPAHDVPRPPSVETVPARK